VPAQRKNQARRGRRNKHNARSRGKRRRQISQVCWKPRGYWYSRRPRVGHDQSRDGRRKGQVVRGMWTKRHVDAREKVESGRDLVCVAVRCTGGEHIVTRAVSRMRNGLVTIASERASASGARAGIYWICCNFVFLKNFPKYGLCILFPYPQHFRSVASRVRRAARNGRIENRPGGFRRPVTWLVQLPVRS